MAHCAEARCGEVRSVSGPSEGKESTASEPLVPEPAVQHQRHGLDHRRRGRAALHLRRRRTTCSATPRSSGWAVHPISLVHPDDLARALDGWERALAQPGRRGLRGGPDAGRRRIVAGRRRSPASTCSTTPTSAASWSPPATSPPCAGPSGSPPARPRCSRSSPAADRSPSVASACVRLLVGQRRDRAGRRSTCSRTTGWSSAPARRRRRSPSGCARPSAAPTAACATGPSQTERPVIVERPPGRRPRPTGCATSPSNEDIRAAWSQPIIVDHRRAARRLALDALRRSRTSPRPTSGAWPTSAAA